MQNYADVKESPQHFDSTRDALDFLRNHVLETSRTDDDRLLFRGERRAYPLTCSVDRLPAAEKEINQKLLHELSWHLIADFFEATVWIREDEIFIDGKRMEIQPTVERIKSTGLGMTEALVYFTALFQHYGWPSNYIDVSYAPEVALFFASYNFSTDRFESSDIGHLYWWDPVELRQKKHDIWIADLCHLRDLIQPSLEIDATRPGRQVGASLMVGFLASQSRDDEYSILESCRKKITFDRRDAQDCLKAKEYYFPRDGMLDLLQSHERQYHRFFQAYPGADRGLVAACMEGILKRSAEAREDAVSGALGMQRDELVALKGLFYDLAYHSQFIRRLKQLQKAQELNWIPEDHPLYTLIRGDYASFRDLQGKHHIRIDFGEKVFAI